MFEAKAIEVAVGQITGYIKPSDAERKAAYELFVELSTRTATVSVDDDRPSVRATLDDLGEISQLTRDILRTNGADSAKDRADGNVTLAVIALRVVNEIVGPRLSTWLPLLAQHESQRADDTFTAYQWENEWEQRGLCIHALDSMRVEVRSYMDTLARIAGAPSLSDLVDPPPASAPIPPTMAQAPTIPDGAVARTTMVRWFDIVEGARTLLAKRRAGHDRTAVGSTNRSIGTYEPEPPINIDHDEDRLWNEKGEFWFDYVSDLGDGIDPTIAVAWQLTQSELTLPIDRSGTLPAPPAELPRGSLLVMGGDQVYPYASENRYRNQLILPYHVAAEANCAGDSGPAPRLVAIPGNHDWYGGSEHFERVFIDNDEFAGHWDTTAQTQRWWAVKLAPGWWMWGLDTGLDNTLDADQIRYFDQASLDLVSGDQVIVCTPAPMWQLRQKYQDRYFELRAFLQKTVQDRGASTPLFLAGDSHFFAHYRRVDGVADEHHITSGGGGAFLQPTHNLVEQVPFEQGAPDFKLGGRWPRPVDSRALGANLGGLSDRQFRLIFVLLATVFAAFSALVARSHRIGDSDPADGPLEAVRWVVGGWFGWPILLVIMLASVQAAVPNSKEPGLKKGSRRYGSIHGGLQIAGFVLVAAGARWLVPSTNWLVHFVAAPLVGGVLATAVMIIVVRWINRRIRVSDTLAYSSAHVTRYKHFVRMRITKAGDLSVYVIGLDPVGEHWWDALTKQPHATSLHRGVRKNDRDVDTVWQRQLLVPPFDRAGVPQIHHVWGKTFAAGSEEQLMERERDLGRDHPDTILSRNRRSARLLTRIATEADPARAVALADATIDLLDTNIESCVRTFPVDHRTTLTNRQALAEALLGHPSITHDHETRAVRQLRRVFDAHVRAEAASERDLDAPADFDSYTSGSTPAQTERARHAATEKAERARRRVRDSAARLARAHNRIARNRLERGTVSEEEAYVDTIRLIDELGGTDARSPLMASAEGRLEAGVALMWGFEPDRAARDEARDEEGHLLVAKAVHDLDPASARCFEARFHLADELDVLSQLYADCRAAPSEDAQLIGDDVAIELIDHYNRHPEEHRERFRIARERGDLDAARTIMNEPLRVIDDLEERNDRGRGRFSLESLSLLKGQTQLALARVGDASETYKKLHEQYVESLGRLHPDTINTHCDLACTVIRDDRTRGLQMLRDVLADCDDARDAPGGHDVNPIRLRVARYFVAGLFERLATEGRHEELERETIEQLELLESSTDPYDRAWSRARLLDVFELTERYDDVIARLSHDIANRTSLSHAHAIVRRNLARHHIGIDEFDAVDESYAQELTDTDVDLRATMQWAHDTVDFGPDAERTVDWFAQVLDLAEFRLIEARPDEVVVLLDLLIDDDGTPLLFRMPPRHRHRADALRSRARYLLDATHARAERPDDDPTDSQTRWTDASLTRWTAFVDDAGDPSDHGPSSATAVTERARLAEALESRGDSMSALEQYEEILAAIEAKPLLERKWLFHVCQEVSRLSLDCNDAQRAIVMCERTLSLFDAGLPPNVRAWGTSEFDLEEVLLSGSLRPLNRAGLQMRLASALLSDGRLDEADEMCHSAVEAAAGAFGRENLQRRVLADLHDEIRRAREVVAASEPG